MSIAQFYAIIIFAISLIGVFFIKRIGKYIYAFILFEIGIVLIIVTGFLPIDNWGKMGYGIIGISVMGLAIVAVILIGVTSLIFSYFKKDSSY
ncbi:hypothetical protein MHH85_07145 [Viridibacillus sp. FSL E2-0187]|uniref:hypothetical protein n=1 Tax=Viridibacillus TaxID=496496 RepID=UPI0030FA95CF